MYWSCYIPYIQTIGWAPNIEQDTRNYSFLSPISKDYLSIIDWLSYKHHFAFKIIPTIVASHWRDSITHFNHKEFEVCYNKKMLLHFLLNIHNFPDSCFIDEVHFKRLQLY